VRGADNLTTLICQLSCNLGASSSWNPEGVPSPIQGFIYLQLWRLLTDRPRKEFPWIARFTLSLMLLSFPVPHISLCHRHHMVCHSVLTNTDDDNQTVASAGNKLVIWVRIGSRLTQQYAWREKPKHRFLALV
jgi:hypothetical protein